MIRTGLGYDVHPFAAGRRLVLGGIEVPAAFGLDGHSDADVLLHAVMDALLGAAGLGDIGLHFPPSDEQWREADSRVLTRRVVAMLEPEWWIVNVDTTLVAEQPRLAPYRDRIRAGVAEVLGVRIDQVNIKATTNEGMGFVGRREGIAALAIATLERRPDERPVNHADASTMADQGGVERA